MIRIKDCVKTANKFIRNGKVAHTTSFYTYFHNPVYLFKLLMKTCV